MADVGSISRSALTPIQDVARVAEATQGSPELRRALLGQIAERVGQGDYVRQELTEEAAKALAQSSSYETGRLLHRVA